MCCSIFGRRKHVTFVASHNDFPICTNISYISLGEFETEEEPVAVTSSSVLTSQFSRAALRTVAFEKYATTTIGAFRTRSMRQTTCRILRYLLFVGDRSLQTYTFEQDLLTGRIAQAPALQFALWSLFQLQSRHKGQRSCLKTR
jgi:hypothetical protein